MFRDDQNNLIVTRKEPVGVCGLITPWNFPLLMTAMKMAPVLAAGCTGVFKPSAEASLSSLKLAELWESLEGASPGVINMITGGNEAGQAITEHTGIQKIAFTGSTATGRKIMQAASVNMKRLTLELGGKSPLVVMNDANMAKATGMAYGLGFANSGQFCMAPTRIFV